MQVSCTCGNLTNNRVLLSRRGSGIASLHLRDIDAGKHSGLIICVLTMVMVSIVIGQDLAEKKKVAT